MPEENVVALIVKRHATFPLKLRFVMEQGRQHTSHCVTQSSGKVVENHFGAEGGDLTPVFLQKPKIAALVWNVDMSNHTKIPCTLMSLAILTLLRRKWAVGPLGKWDTIMPLG